MNSKYRLYIVDSIIVMFSMYISLTLIFEMNIPQSPLTFLGIKIFLIVILTLFFNKIFNLYDCMWKYATGKEFLTTVISTSVSNIILFAISYIIYYRKLSYIEVKVLIMMHIVYWILVTIMMIIARIFIKVRDNKYTGDIVAKNKINTLIFGAGDAGVMLFNEIKRHKSLNYKVVGFIDDDLSKVGKSIFGIKVLGNRKNIDRICRENEVEEILIAVPSIPFKSKKEIYNICKDTGCRLKTLPGLYEIINGDVKINQLREVDINDLLGRKSIKLNNENINKYINDKVVLVTGGGGSIGSELCRQITKFKPKKLLVLDIYENNAYDLQMELKRQHKELDLEVIIASIRDEKRLEEIFSRYKPYVVFHAAAHKHVPLMEDNPKEAIKNNVIGTYNLAKYSEKYDVKKFVQISTDKAVNPTNVMGATKRFCEKIIQGFAKESNTEYVAVRFGNVLGSNGSVIPLFKKQISSGGPVTVTHPEINRFFMTIPEAAQLVIQAGAIARGGEIFVLDMGKPVKIVDLAKDLIRLSGLKPNEDIKIEYSGLRPGEKLYEELLIDEVALTTTDYEKIFVEKPHSYDMEYINSSIDQFKKVIEKDNIDVINLLKEKVSTYKPNEK
ncbi:polysaccharide biosynthesis protein [Clostridium sp. DL1XJH146]